VPLPRSGSSRQGWLVASYAGAPAFFALGAVAREPGEASDLAAADSDQGTTRQIVAAYGLAAGLAPVLRRFRAGRLPPVSGPAGVGADDRRAGAARLVDAHARRILFPDPAHHL
jgi:hypothetical protein